MKSLNTNSNYSPSEVSQIVNEMYSKCFRLRQDITDGVNEIRKGIHKIGAIDKVKQKINEKIENFEESLRMMDRIILQLSSENEREMWKKYT